MCQVSIRAVLINQILIPVLIAVTKEGDQIGMTNFGEAFDFSREGAIHSSLVEVLDCNELPAGKNALVDLACTSSAEAYSAAAVVYGFLDLCFGESVKTSPFACYFPWCSSSALKTCVSVIASVSIELKCTGRIPLLCS